MGCVDVVAAKRRAQRRRPSWLVGREIGGGQQATVVSEEALELLRDVAPVEAIERRLDRGSARPSIAPTATAASKALPPLRSIFSPADEAIG